MKILYYDDETNFRCVKKFVNRINLGILFFRQVQEKKEASLRNLNLNYDFSNI